MYKKFKDIKEGDTLYCVEINFSNYKFQQVKVREISEIYSDNKIIETYIDKSPLSFSFNRQTSNWHNLVFTTKEEAIKSAIKQLKEKIKYFKNQSKKYEDAIKNINDIEFR